MSSLTVTAAIPAMNNVVPGRQSPVVRSVSSRGGTSLSVPSFIHSGFSSPKNPANVGRTPFGLPAGQSSPIVNNTPRLTIGTGSSVVSTAFNPMMMSGSLSQTAGGSVNVVVDGSRCRSPICRARPIVPTVMPPSISTSARLNVSEGYPKSVARSRSSKTKGVQEELSPRPPLRTSRISNAMSPLSPRQVHAEKAVDKVSRSKSPTKFARNQSPKKSARNHRTPMLNSLGRDLTVAAEAGQLDPLIGRDMQIELMMQSLARRRKNNPVLVGDPGVGKTAVVEGLAQRIAKGLVPEVLQDKHIVQLDVSSLIAGTKNRGEFEQRMKTLLDEVLASKKQIILFIDEIHTLVGAGRSGGECSIDAASILKPVLARGDIQCIGVTTLGEYRARIEKDSSLERRFQPITVEQTSISETVDILKGLSSKYESHHTVEYLPDALEACVKLAAEHIPDRYMPDKAIDVFDEVGAFVNLRHKASAKSGKGGTESDALKEIRKSLNEVRVEKELAVKSEKYSVAARLKLREMGLQRQLEETEIPADTSESNKDVAVVTQEDVARVISKLTGVPVEKLSEDESERMMKLEEILHTRIIGQLEAVTSVSKALRRARVGLKKPNRPIASFLFCGPTGVGKTELCKALASAYFGKDDSMIRLDMSEFMERHSVSKLIGSPPGYVGYTDENQLTDRIRRKPYTVVLFDEVEKAHPDVLNLMLQMMEDGCLTDSTGRTVSFKNALIILTSNADELSQFFAPEFLNRLDEIIRFRALIKEEIAAIADLEISKTVERVKERGVFLTCSDAWKAKVIDRGFDTVFGARPLRRAVVNLLDDELASSVLRQPFISGEHVHVDVNDDLEVVVIRQDPEPSLEASTEGATDHADSESAIDSESTKERVQDRMAEQAMPMRSPPTDTESTKDSECSGKDSLRHSQAGSSSPRKPLSELVLSDCLTGPLHNLRSQMKSPPSKMAAIEAR